MSWWDYGYQITAMANRTILVDNNTWNNTHISRVGQVSCASRWIGVFFRLLQHWPSVCSVGHGLHWGESLWNHEGAGRQLRPGHFRRVDGLFFRRWGIIKKCQEVIIYEKSLFYLYTSSMCVYIYLYSICICTYINVYMYIYIYEGFTWQRNITHGFNDSVHLCVCFKVHSCSASTLYTG